MNAQLLCQICLNTCLCSQFKSFICGHGHCKTRVDTLFEHSPTKSDEIQESNYFTQRGEYRVDDAASKTMKDSLMYEMSYYRFADLFGGGQAMDRVRNQQAPKNIELDYLDEAFTSENWIVRLYQVRKEDILGRDLKSANAFEKGKKRKRSKPLSRRRAIV
ncbi:hypothetical protein DFP72DRAFT_1170937 [Ephemerocybe angulata]|uniref:Uncharacterized protein n=1 Tax=Ephemerocybe angulata TaxID=980116 RepID=A0A8H6HVC9_9AGAR|nr:hypothetical protein DFP72DRAFT_1170937 [Tulosesus angulatus]